MLAMMKVNRYICKKGLLNNYRNCIILAMMLRRSMFVKQYLVNNKHIQLAIALKTNQMKREQLSSLTYQHVENTLMGLTWKYKRPSSVHEAINDILKLNANEVVAFLSNQAVIVGSQMELNEIKSILGGD